jgi:hypothetical protein
MLDKDAILLQDLAAVLSGLTAGLDEVAVHGGRIVKVFHQGEQRGFVPGGELWADSAPAAWLLGCVGHGLNGLEIGARSRVGLLSSS